MSANTFLSVDPSLPKSALLAMREVFLEEGKEEDDAPDDSDVSDILDDFQQQPQIEFEQDQSINKNSKAGLNTKYAQSIITQNVMDSLATFMYPIVGSKSKFDELVGKLAKATYLGDVNIGEYVVGSLFFTDLKFKWSEQNKSFYSVGTPYLNTILGKKVYKSIFAYVELKKEAQ